MFAELAGLALLAGATLGRMTPEERVARAESRRAAAAKTKAKKEQRAIRKMESRFRSPAQVVERIEERYGAGAAPRTLPAHVKPYANYLVSREGQEPTVRDVIKAYVLTSSSIQRGARAKRAICADYPEYRTLAKLRREREVASVEERIASGCLYKKTKDGKVSFSGKKRGGGFDIACTDPQMRPEDVMAVLLFSEHGQRYLNAAERGVFDADAARELVRRTTCFGLSGRLYEALEDGVELGRRRQDLVAALRGSDDDWIRFVAGGGIKGVKFAKVGFIASLLGRGDIPTLDARELKLWLTKPQKDADYASLKVFQRKIAVYPMSLEPQHEKHRGHLVHHALWDAFPETGKPTRTTHGALIRAMQFAGAKE